MKKVCTNCGREHEGMDDVCEQCKAIISTNPEQDTQKSGGQKKQNKGTFSLGSIVATIVIFLVVFYGIDGGFSKAMAKDLTSNPYIAYGFALGNYRVKSSCVKGTVTANEGIDVQIGVEITFYNKKKSVIDTRYDYCQSFLQQGESWEFSVAIPNDSAYYKITKVAYIQ